MSNQDKNNTSTNHLTTLCHLLNEISHDNSSSSDDDDDVIQNVLSNLIQNPVIFANNHDDDDGWNDHVILNTASRVIRMSKRHETRCLVLEWTAMEYIQFVEHRKKNSDQDEKCGLVSFWRAVLLYVVVVVTIIIVISSSSSSSLW